MGLTDEALAQLGRRHAEERAFVRSMIRRDRLAATSAERASEMVVAMQAEHATVLSRWAAPEWTSS